MPNMIETILQSISPEARSALAAYFGETPDSTDRALVSIIPTLLAAMVSRSEHGGLESVAALVRTSLEHDNALDDLSAALSDPGRRSRLLANGGSFVSALLGGQLGPVSAALTGRSGVKGDTIRGLLQLGGSLVTGGVGKMLGHHQPTSQELSTLLKSERADIFARLPSGISSLLAPLSGAATPATAAAALASDPAARTDRGFSRWLPWILAAIVALAIIFSLRSCETEEPVAVEETKTIVTEAPPPAAPAELPPPPPGSGVLSEVRDGHPAVVVFFDSGSSAVTPAFPTATAPLKNWLDANPEATLSVSGYNDPTGDAAANAELSKNRASNVADELVAAGIDRSRITLDKPAEATAYDEHRTEARRVEVVIRP
ncbi:MAG: OmpA family protein [Sphingomonadaceae bacterium]